MQFVVELQVFHRNGTVVRYGLAASCDRRSVESPSPVWNTRLEVTRQFRCDLERLLVPQGKPIGTKIGINTPREIIVISTDRIKKKADGSSPTKKQHRQAQNCRLCHEDHRRECDVCTFVKSVCSLRVLKFFQLAHPTSAAKLPTQK